MSFLLRGFFFSLVIMKVVRCDTSLWIPGFDSQPLSVANIGTDGQGRTTWEIVPGTLTGTFDMPSFYGTAIMVQGPQDAHVTYSDADISESFDISCTITQGIADCTADEGYFTTPYAFGLQTISPFIVQGGQTASPPAWLNPSPSPAQGSPSYPAPTSVISSSSAPAPAPSGTSSTPSASPDTVSASLPSVTSPASSAPSSSSALSQSSGSNPTPSASLISGAMTNAATMAGVISGFILAFALL